MELYQKLNLSVSAALSDVFLVGSIALLNMGGDWVAGNFMNSVPMGYPRMFAQGGLNAVIDISKFTLFDMSINHGLGQARATTGAA